MWFNVEYVRLCQFSDRVKRALPQNREIERKNWTKQLKQCLVGDSICSLIWYTNFRWSTACMRECSRIYQLSGLNLPSQWPYLRYSVFTVVSSKKEWISKQKSNKLTCTENLMIKLWTAILLLVEVEPFVCSRVHNLNEIFLVLLVPYFDRYLSAMLEFCDTYTHLKIKKEQKTCFKILDKDADRNIPFKGCKVYHRKWWSLWQTRCLIRVIFYLHFKLKRP